MEKKSSTLESQKLQSSPSLEAPLNHFSGSSSRNDTDGKKRKKVKHDTYSHNSSLWKNLSYIFSTKTSSSASVKVIREKESPIRRLSSFFRHKKHNVNTIKPLTNIGISPKGYQVAISETSMQPNYEKGLAVAVRLPKGTATGNVSVTVEMDLPGKSDELLLTSNDDKPMTMKCCEETDSVTIFTGVLRLPPNTNMSQLINMPLYLIDSSEKLVLNAGYKLWHETVVKSCDDLEVDKKEKQLLVDDVRIKLTLEKDKRHKGATESYENDLKSDATDVMDDVAECDEYVNNPSEMKPTNEDCKYDAVPESEEFTIRNTTSRHSANLKCDSLIALHETNDSKVVNIGEAYATLNQVKDFTDDPTEYITEPDEEKTLYDVKENDFNSVAHSHDLHYEENEADFTDTDDSVDYINELSDVTHIIYDSKAFINELSATKATRDDIKEIISDSTDFINELSVEDATTANIKAIIYDSLDIVDQYGNNNEASIYDSITGNERNKAESVPRSLDEIMEERFLATTTSFERKPEECNETAATFVDDSRNNDNGRLEELEPTNAGDITYNLQNIDYYPSMAEEDNTSIYNDTENVEKAALDSDGTNKYDLQGCDNQRNEEEIIYDENYPIDVVPSDDINNYEVKDEVNDGAIVEDIDLNNCDDNTCEFVNRHNTRNATDLRKIIFDPTAYNNSVPERTQNLDGVLVGTVDCAKEVTDKKASTDIRKAVYELVEHTTALCDQNSSNDRETDEEKEALNLKLIASDSNESTEGNGKPETQLAEIIYETVDYVESECNKQETISNVKDMLYSTIDAATKKTHENVGAPEAGMQDQEQLPYDRQSYKKMEEQDALASADEIKKYQEARDYEERSRAIGKSVDEQVGFPMSPYPIPIPINKSLCNTSAQYSLTNAVNDKEVDIQSSLFKNYNKSNNNYDTGSSFTLPGSAKFFVPSGGSVTIQKPSVLSENDSSESVWPMSTSVSQYSSSFPSYPSSEFLRITFQRPELSDNTPSGATVWPLSSPSAGSAYSSTLLSSVSESPKGNTSKDTTQLGLSGARYIDILPSSGNLKLAARKLSEASGNISTETELPLSNTSTYTRYSDTLVSFPISDGPNISEQKPEDDVSEATEWPVTSTSTFERHSDTLLSMPFYTNSNEKPKTDLAATSETIRRSYTIPSNTLPSNNRADLVVPVNSPNSYTDLPDGTFDVKPVHNALDFSLNSKCFNKISLKYKKPDKNCEPVALMRDGAATNRSEEYESQTQKPTTFYSSEEELCSTDLGQNSAERCKFAITNEVDKTLELLKGVRSRLSSLTVEKDEVLNNLSDEPGEPGGNNSTKEARNLDPTWNAAPFDTAGTEKPQIYKEEGNDKRYYEDKDEYYEKQRSNVRRYFEEENRLDLYNMDVYNQECTKKNFDSLLSGDIEDKSLIDGSDLIKQNYGKTEDINNLTDPLVPPSEYISDVINVNTKINTEINKLHYIYKDMCTILDEASGSISNRSSTTPMDTSSDNQDSINCPKETTANSNECTHLDKKLSEERCQTYMTVENDIKRVIKELLKESEDIKEAAILQGAREEPEPPFSCDYINFTNEPVILCKSAVEDIMDSTTKLSTEKDEELESKCRYEDVKDILNILVESIIKSKHILDNSNFIQTDTFQSNDVIKSLSLLTNANQNCNDIYIGDVNYANNNNKRYITESENKHNHINRYITYFCKTTVFKPKIPKTSYSFGEVPYKCSEIPNQIFETSAKPRDSLTITGMDHSTRDLGTSRLFKELLKLKQTLDSEKNSILSNLLVPRASLCLPVLKMISIKKSVANKSDRTKKDGNDKPNASGNPEKKAENANPANKTAISGTSSIQKSQKCFKLGETNQAISVNLPTTSSVIVAKETRTTDEEEIIKNLYLGEETEASTAEHECFLSVAAQELQKNVLRARLQEVFESSSSEEGILPSASKVKSNNAGVVEIHPIASIISNSDTESNFLVEANPSSTNNSEHSGKTLRVSTAVSNLCEISKKQAEEYDTSDDTEYKTSDTEYDGDNETVQLRLPSSSQRYKSAHELNSPQEIAAIEQNVLENEMLTKKHVLRGSTTSPHLEYEDYSSVTQSEASIEVLSDDNSEIATADNSKSPTSSVQQSKIDHSPSASTI